MIGPVWSKSIFWNIQLRFGSSFISILFMNVITGSAFRHHHSPSTSSLCTEAFITYKYNTNAYSNTLQLGRDYIFCSSPPKTPLEPQLLFQQRAERVKAFSKIVDCAYTTRRCSLRRYLLVLWTFLVWVQLLRRDVAKPSVPKRSNRINQSQYGKQTWLYCLLDPKLEHDLLNKHTSVL